jgi:hypothetical protein
LKQKPLGLYQENKYIFINYTMEWKVWLVMIGERQETFQNARLHKDLCVCMCVHVKAKIKLQNI